MNMANIYSPENIARSRARAEGMRHLADRIAADGDLAGATEYREAAASVDRYADERAEAALDVVGVWMGVDAQGEPQYALTEWAATHRGLTNLVPAGMRRRDAEELRIQARVPQMGGWQDGEQSPYREGMSRPRPVDAGEV